MRFDQSNVLREKAQKLIPGGAHTYSKGDDQFPQLSPGFIQRGKGALVWDLDGNEFLDWGMGLRTVCLGHAYEPVLGAVREALNLGVNFTRPSPYEANLAERIVETIPSAEMVKFAKNGSDVTTAAVRLARAYTGRDLVVRCLDHPFFSIDDWFIGDTAMSSGVPEVTRGLTKHFPYNDLAALERLFGEYEGDVACVILEPAATAEPQPGFLQKVKQLTARAGAVLIFDEIITGFRWDVRGAQHYYDVTPDLATFGKAMGNGFSISALTGKREIMELGGLEHKQRRVFLLSSTNGGEIHHLAAASRTLEILSDGSIIAENWRIGQALYDGFNDLCVAHDLRKRICMRGPVISPHFLFLDEAGNADPALRTLFLQETIAHGVLMSYISISASHREAEVTRTLEAADKALITIARAIEQDAVNDRLMGPVVKPVFRAFN